MTFLEVDKGVHESARKDGNVAERNRVARSPPESHDEKGNEYAPAPDTAGGSKQQGERNDEERNGHGR